MPINIKTTYKLEKKKNSEDIYALQVQEVQISLYTSLIFQWNEI